MKEKQFLFLCFHVRLVSTVIFGIWKHAYVRTQRWLLLVWWLGLRTARPPLQMRCGVRARHRNQTEKRRKKAALLQAQREQPRRQGALCECCGWRWWTRARETAMRAYPTPQPTRYWPPQINKEKGFIYPGMPHTDLSRSVKQRTRGCNWPTYPRNLDRSIGSLSFFFGLVCKYCAIRCFFVFAVIFCYFESFVHVPSDHRSKRRWFEKTFRPVSDFESELNT